MGRDPFDIVVDSDKPAFACQESRVSHRADVTIAPPGRARRWSSGGLLGLVVEDQKLAVLERKLRIGAPLVIGEFDFKDAGR